MFVLGRDVHCDCLKAFSVTYTPGDTPTHRTLHTFLFHLCVYSSKVEPVSQSDLHVV